MPVAPRRPCPYPGCPTRISTGERYCAEHRRAKERERGDSTQRGYDRSWQKLSKLFRQQHPLCGCGALGELVDHIVPVRVDPSRRLDLGNLQTMCRRCHKLKTDADARREWGEVTPREPSL